MDARLDIEVDEEFIRTQKPDILIMASGADHFVSDIPGKDKALSVSDVMRDRVELKGQTAVVIGGRMVGREVAYVLADAHSFLISAGVSSIGFAGGASE